MLFYLDRNQAKSFFENPAYFVRTDTHQFGDIVAVSSSYEMYEWTKTSATGSIYEYIVINGRDGASFGREAYNRSQFDPIEILKKACANNF